MHDTDDPMLDTPQFCDLKLLNQDQRLSSLSLQAKGHIYRDANGDVVHWPSLTSTIALCHNMYDEVPLSVLRAAADKGTQEHSNVEQYLNGKLENSVEGSPVPAPALVAHSHSCSTLAHLDSAAMHLFLRWISPTSSYKLH